MKKVFTPEKVRELAKFTWNNTSFTIEDYEKRITEWLEQNPIEPVVVGLSDEQFFSLAQDVFCHTYNPKMEELFDDFRRWKKTQAFTQSQQFTPNWGDAPNWANWLMIDDSGIQSWHELEPYFEEIFFSFNSDGKNEFAHNELQHVILKRPQTKPIVEVGQIWGITSEYDAVKVVIIALNDADVVLQNEFSKGFNVYSIKDFLSKFEHVA